MQAQRIITHTDNMGKLSDMPTFQPGRRVELILLYSDDIGSATCKKRHPPRKLKGVIAEKGDIFSTSPESDWGIS
jgi:hypothetical protein